MYEITVTLSDGSTFECESEDEPKITQPGCLLVVSDGSTYAWSPSSWSFLSVEGGPNADQ